MRELGRAHPGCLFGPDLQCVSYLAFSFFLHSTVVIPRYVLELVLRSWIGCLVFFFFFFFLYIYIMASIEHHFQQFKKLLFAFLSTSSVMGHGSSWMYIMLGGVVCRFAVEKALKEGHPKLAPDAFNLHAEQTYPRPPRVLFHASRCQRDHSIL